MKKMKQYSIICSLVLCMILFLSCEVDSSQTSVSYDYYDFVDSSIDASFIGTGSNDEGTFSVDTEDENLSFICTYDGYKKLIITIYNDNDDGGVNSVETSGVTTTIIIYKNWLSLPLYSVDLNATTYTYTSSTSYALVLSLTADDTSYEIDLDKTSDLTDSTWTLSQSGSELAEYDGVNFQ